MNLINTTEKKNREPQKTSNTLLTERVGCGDGNNISKSFSLFISTETKRRNGKGLVQSALSIFRRDSFFFLKKKFK